MSGRCQCGRWSCAAGRDTHARIAARAAVQSQSGQMVLPQGVSKATGLHAALEMLRLSARNTLAIGDAENDHELLRIAEIGVAVSWGPALRAVADLVVSGAGPVSVEFPAHAGRVEDDAVAGPGKAPAAARIYRGWPRVLAGRPWAQRPRCRRRKIGKVLGGGPAARTIDLHGYSVCVLDPGDYRSMEALPGVAVLGGEDPPPTPRQLARALRYPDRSVVVDLSRLPHDDKIAHPRGAAGTQRDAPPHRSAASDRGRRSPLLPAR